jgi:predicted nucleic acid-binding protein
MTMGDRVFIDTNALLRANHQGLGLYREANTILAQFRQDGYELWISRQVIREYLVQLTRPGLLKKPLTAREVEVQVKGLRTLFRIADETEAVTEMLIELMKSFPGGGKQVHDTNIVATMLVNGIGTLVTNNVSDMKRSAEKITIAPLIEAM